MSELNPEAFIEPVSPLAMEVLARSKNAYETLESFRDDWDRSSTSRSEHKQPDIIALTEALGKFAAAHLDDGLEKIVQLPLPEEVTVAVDLVTARLVRDKLNRAIYDQYEKREAATIAELLAGRTIVATSLRYGHAYSDGYGIESGSDDLRSNLTVIGKFLRIDPSQGSFWLGEPEKCYRVDLWSKEYDVVTKNMTEARQQSTLEVINDPDFIMPARVGKMAILASRLTGKVPENVIERGIMLEASRALQY